MAELHIPKVEFVNVIRCKDCKYYRTPTDEFDYCHCTHEQWENDNGWAREIHPNDYCSYAERAVTKDA